MAADRSLVSDSPTEGGTPPRRPIPATANAVLSRLRLKQLALVVELDHHKSLRKAAAAMRMTQSAASKALAEIEGLFGSALFVRSKAGIEPNPLGACVIRYARLLRADVEAMRQEVARLQLGGSGRLAVGAIMGAVPRVLTDAIEALRIAEPDISIEIIEDTSLHLLELLDEGHLELVIGRVAVSPKPALYRFDRLCDEPLSVVVGPLHPLWPARRATLDDLRPCTWIVYPSRMPLRTTLENELMQAGIDVPANVIETSSAFATLALLRSSRDLVALLPNDVCALFSGAQLLRALPIALKARTQPFGLITRQGCTLSPIGQRFADAVRGSSRQAAVAAAAVDFDQPSACASAAQASC